MVNYKNDSRKTFDKMASKYEQSTYGSFSKMLYNKIIPKIKSFKHESILDLGCGKGLLLEKLKETKSKLFGADISPEMIKHAKERLGDFAELKVADSENLPWDKNSFDVITCTVSFHHYPYPIKSLNEMKRVLKNKGHIIIAEGWIPAPFRNLANWLIKSGVLKTGDVKVYSKDEWVNMLEQIGFKNINIEKANCVSILIIAEISK